MQAKRKAAATAPGFRAKENTELQRITTAGVRVFVILSEAKDLL